MHIKGEKKKCLLFGKHELGGTVEEENSRNITQ